MREESFSALLILCCCTLYGNTLYGAFVWDDRAAIVNNRDVLGSTSFYEMLGHDFWGQDITLGDSHKSYRPITTFTFRINHWLHGLNAWGYHVGNVLIYSLVCLVMHQLALCWVSRSTARVASLIFCFHPVHVEAVASLVGRADSLCGLLTLIALCIYSVTLQEMRKIPSSTRRFATGLRTAVYLSMSYSAAIAACFAKEIGATVFGLLCVVEVCDVLSVTYAFRKTDKIKVHGSGISRYIRDLLAVVVDLFKSIGVVFNTRESLIRIAVNILLLAAILYLRLRINGEAALYPWTIMENHISLLPDFSDRALSYAQTHFWYLMKLVYPRYLCFDYGFSCIPTIHSIFDLRNIFSLATYAAFTWATLHALIARRPSLLFSLALLLLPFLPAANILFPVGTVLAERLLFIPSMGFCLYLADVLCEDFFPFWLQITEVIIGGIQYPQQIFPPTSSSSSGFHIAEKHKTFALSSINIALSVVLTLFSIRVVSRNADWTSEIQIYKSALTVCPNSVKALSNYAMLELGEGKENSLQTSLTHSEKALFVHPEQPSAFVNAGIALTRLRRNMLGVHYFERSIELRPNDAKSFGYLAMAYFDWSMLLAQDVTSDQRIVAVLRNKSITAFDAAFERGFYPPNVLHSRASLALEQGEFEVTIQCLELALQETSRLKELSGDAPLQDLVHEPFTYNQLGVAYERVGRDAQAENAYLRGLLISPGLCEITINLCNLYRRLGRFTQALETMKTCAVDQSGLHGPHLAVYYNTFGNLFRDIGDRDKAIDMFTTGLSVLDVSGNNGHVNYEIIRSNLMELT